MADFVVVGGTPIKVSPSSGKADWNDGVDRRRVFNNNYFASATGGAARDWHFSTPPITRAVAGTYRAVLSQVQAQMCSGEGLELPTMCCAELIGETPVKGAASNYVSLDFALHESQSKRLLLKYTPGDVITGESFTRASSAFYHNGLGIYVSVGNNVKRDAHVPPSLGANTLLLEDARTNSILWSHDLTNATYTKAGTGSIAQNAVGLDGSANSATTLTDSGAGDFYTAFQSIAIVNDGNYHTISFYIKKDAVASRFVGISAALSGGTGVSVSLHLNTQTGAITTASAPVGTLTYRVISMSLWWVVEVALANNSTGNTSLLAQVYPAVGTVFGTNSAAAQGSCVVGQIQIEKNTTFSSSPIFTTTAAATRAADSYSVPFTTTPQEMTVYIKFVELGTTLGAGGARLWQISDAPSNAPQHEVYDSAGLYNVYHNNGGSAVAVALASAPAYADTAELASHLYGLGSVDLTQSINGGAATTTAQTGTPGFAAAWSGPLLWLNSEGTVGNRGYVAIQSLKIVAGSRSLAEMRAA